MKYDHRIHMGAVELAALIGIPVAHLSSRTKAKFAPKPIGLARVDVQPQRIFDRAEVEDWIEANTEKDEPKHPPYKGEIVPPRDLSMYQNRDAYRPTRALTDNFARAAQLYPNGIRSQGGVVGNGVVYARGFGERV